MKLVSSVFNANGAIPRRHTCEGDDVAPPLAWSDAPAATRSFALIVDDPDAPDPAAPKMTWVHWVLYDIPASVHDLPEGGSTPAGARDGVNDWQRTGYGGPCPPIGRHRYFFKLYALDAVARRPASADQGAAADGDAASCAGSGRTCGHL